MRRPMVYLLAGGVAFVVGMGLGIAGHNCSHPEQPPFLECAFEDPQDTFIPAIVLSLLTISVVAAIDLIRRASGNKERTSVPNWRRWTYVLLLVVIAAPAAKIALEQANEVYSDSDPLLIFLFGTLIITPFIVVDFVIWAIRRYGGWRRLIPFALVATVGALVYFLTRDPDLECLNDFPTSDNVGCYGGMQLIIVQFSILAAMVGGLFIPMPATEWSSRTGGMAESTHR